METITLKDLLDLAGGFDDPIFRKTIDENIVVLRLDENQFYAKDFSIQYNKADNFKLKVNDKIFVYEKPQYENSFIYNQFNNNKLVSCIYDIQKKNKNHKP